MLKIGLTGSFGSGKSTVAALFAKQGGASIDADAITHHILTKNVKCRKEVAKIFPDVILQSGEVDRKRLAEYVFKNPRELKKLTTIIYPEAVQEIKRQLKAHHTKALVVLDVPLLFEAGWDQLTDVNIVVKSTRKEQIKRIQRRMGLSKTDIVRRLKFQMPLTQKCQLADIIIDNSGSLADTRAQVNAIIHRLNQRKS